MRIYRWYILRDGAFVVYIDRVILATWWQRECEDYLCEPELEPGRAWALKSNTSTGPGHEF